LFFKAGNLRRFYQVRNEMGAMSYNQNKFEQSQKYFEENLALMIKNSDTLHHEFAIALRFMGYIAGSVRNSPLPKMHYINRQYEVLNKMGDTSPIFADCLGDLGLYHMRNSNVGVGLNYLLRATEYTTDPGSLFIINHSITDKLSSSQPDLALEIFEQVFNTNKPKNFRDSSNLVFLAYHIGVKQQLLKNYQKAIEFFEKSAQLNQKIGYPHKKLINGIPIELASAYSYLNDTAKTVEYIQQIIAKTQEFSQYNLVDPITLYSSIGYTYTPFYKDSALHYLEIAKSLILEEEDTDLRKLCEVFAGIANVYYLKKDDENAIENLRNSLNILTMNEPDNDFSFISNGPDEELLLQTYKIGFQIFAQAFAHKPSPKLEQAVINTILCIDTLSKRFATELSDPQSAMLLAQDYKKILEEYLDLESITSKNADLTWYLIASSKAFQLSSEINRFNHDLKNENDENWNKKMALENQIRALKNNRINAALEKNTELESSINAQLTPLLIKLLIANYHVTKSKVQNSEKIFADKLDIRSLKESLQNQTLLIDILQTQNAVYVFAMDKNGEYHHKINIADQYDKAVLNCIRGIKTGGKFEKDAQLLSDLLLKPLAKALSENKHLVVIPDKNLHLLPLDILPNPITKKMLIYSHAVTYHYSSALWLNARKNAKPEHQEILLVAPIFEDNNQLSQLGNNYRSLMDELTDMPELKSGRVPALPFAQKEILDIEKFALKNKWSFKSLTGQNANKQKFETHATNATLIHIATHGVVSKKSPEYSGLFLSSGETDKESANLSFLHMGEIYTLKTQAHLVVLSACHLGSGRIVDGEGILALPRSFIFAGVPNVISSLWKAHDAKTKDLMISFYLNLAKGNTYSESLRLAKIEGIKKGFLPMDWVGFLLIGNE
jgi:CHAT domain-containing protein